MRFSYKHVKSRDKGPRAGFALVLALSLMAFILLLLLSITTLVRVESESSSIKLKTLQAQQNALLGLQIGLGRLQSSAGRDRISTGTIEVDSNLAVDPSKRHWTGVWKNPESYDVARNLMAYGEAELAAVLVSGETVASGSGAPGHYR